MVSSMVRAPVFAGTRTSIIVAAVTLTFGLVVGAISLAGVTTSTSPGDALFADRSGVTLFLAISARNLSVCCLMFSGAITFGISTALASVTLGAYVGATFAAAAANVGLAAALASVAPYAPFEFTGILLASAAGLQPMINTVRDGLGRGSPAARPTGYPASLNRSLRLLAPAGALIALGALVETVSISLRAAA